MEAAEHCLAKVDLARSHRVENVAPAGTPSSARTHPWCLRLGSVLPLSAAASFHAAGPARPFALPQRQPLERRSHIHGKLLGAGVPVSGMPRLGSEPGTSGAWRRRAGPLTTEYP